jgi:Flp pilus assembly protein CpaB
VKWGGLAGFAAGAVAAIAVMAASFGLFSADNTSRAPAATLGPQTGRAVVVAAQEIPAGVEIQRNMLSIYWIPRTEGVPDTLNVTTDIIGRITEVPVAKASW